MLNVERLENGAVTVLRLRGVIDEEGVAVLRLALSGCVRDGRHKVVLNLAGVGFVSYLSMAVILERLGQFRAAKGDLKLACLSLYMRMLLRQMALTHQFDCHETEVQAVTGFSAPDRKSVV